MVCHILCPECSEDLGAIYPFYDTVKNLYCHKLMENNERIIDVDKIDFKTDILKNFEFILKAVGINKMCCVIHILSTSDFDSIY